MGSKLIDLYLNKILSQHSCLIYFGVSCTSIKLSDCEIYNNNNNNKYDRFPARMLFQIKRCQITI